MTTTDLLEPLRRRRSRLERLADQVKTLEKGRYELERAIADYKAFRPEIEMGKIDSREITATNLYRKIADQEVNTTNLDRRLHCANSAKVNPLVVWKYFTAEQKQLRSEASRLASELSSTKQQLSKDQGSLDKVRSDINGARKRILDHANFDLNSSEIRLSSLGPEIDRVTAAHAADSAELLRIETKIRPHTQELDRLKSELATLNADIARANRFEDLSSAANSYERAMIHKGARKSSEQAVPSRSSMTARENTEPREQYSQVERRIRDELRSGKNHRPSSIDGNNACFEGNRSLDSSHLRSASGTWRPI
jgi:chromosome segregation ATPase